MNFIITGASRGIGSELVRILCKNKGNQVFAISRNRDGLKKLQAECLKANPDAKLSVAEFDLSHFEFYPFLLQKIELFFRHCDVLVNNAGRMVNKPFMKTDLIDFDDIFNVNVKGAYFLVQTLMPIMGSGTHIVNIGSLGG
ncbi:MAG TPA: SDR family NAD(P)-dependent oxidoreductase, partial [Bacteroidales bacterium]|nr:SDR family NAD(P)-dependent oxidoreductase [Bacteroidales bacterium]